MQQTNAHPAANLAAKERYSWIVVSRRVVDSTYGETGFAFPDLEVCCADCRESCLERGVLGKSIYKSCNLGAVHGEILAFSVGWGQSSFCSAIRAGCGLVACSPHTCIALRVLHLPLNAS